MKALFIHRSVGNNLINDGDFYRLLGESEYSGELSDYDNNTGLLRDNAGAAKLDLKFPNDNTRPADYAELFSATGKEKYSGLYDLVMSYDFIVIKSCYPNSNIKSDDELKRIKKCYQIIATYFTALPNKKLLILTSPPLRPFAISTDNAHRARLLADWLFLEPLGANVRVFNFFDLLADDSNYLRAEYRKLLPFDNHPNKKASIAVAPKLIQQLKSISETLV